MANINVTFQDLHDASTKLNAGKEEITHKLQELKGFIDGLISNGYVTDQSSVAFGEKYTEFTTGTTQVVEGLTGLAQFLSSAAQALQDADTQLASSIRGQ